MPFFGGFDTRDYPKIDTMNWLTANSNLKWCGYYLAPAPNRGPTGWQGQYLQLKDNWGILPVYVGQQDPNTATANYTPSSILTSAQGTIDGKNAADLATGDSFPLGTFVYLDWEYGGIAGAGAEDYITAWINAVIADGRIMPGIYCSHSAAAAFVTLIDKINPTPNVRFWCWNVSQANSVAHPFAGDLMNIPQIDPTGCGVAGAVAWQREQNATVTLPQGAPVASLQMDFNTSSLADPGAPNAAGVG